MTLEALRDGDPRQVGPYTLLVRLGEGGMGVVYLGQAPDGTRVAVKLIHARMDAQADFRRRFAREVAAAKRVARFCTAPVLDADVEGDVAYLVTEYVEGPSLGDAVRESGPLKGSALDGLAAAMAMALRAIHGAGVVHRDLKPSNVLLSQVGPKVIDFGIAQLMDAEMSSAIVGTPSYMSPEQVSGATIGPASDIFSWGCTVAYAASGRPPFGSGSVPTILLRIVNEAPELHGLSGPLRDLVLASLTKNPGQRPTAQDLMDHLSVADPGLAPLPDPSAGTDAGGTPAPTGGTDTDAGAPAASAGTTDATGHPAHAHVTAAPSEGPRPPDMTTAPPDGPRPPDVTTAPPDGPRPPDVTMAPPDGPRPPDAATAPPDGPRPPGAATAPPGGPSLPGPGPDPGPGVAGNRRRVIAAAAAVAVAVGGASVAVAWRTLGSSSSARTPAQTTQATTTAQAARSDTPAKPQNPLRAPGKITFYSPPEPAASRQAEQWKKDRPEDAELMSKLAAVPHAIRLNAPEVRPEVDATTTAARQEGGVPVFLVNSLPGSECRPATAAALATYQEWIKGIASTIGQAKAVVILEPGATVKVPGVKDCDPQGSADQRYENLRQAVQTLKANPNTAVYLDGSQDYYPGTAIMAERLIRAGIDRADGFFLNTAAYQPTEKSVEYGKALSACISVQRATGAKDCPSDGKVDPATMPHFVVDTARNGQGSWRPTKKYPDPQTWCNPPGRGAGYRPTTDTGEELVDAYLWIARAGSSGGRCRRGEGGEKDPERGVVSPEAGQWWPELALERAEKANPPL
ncbi:glycoside hydrolase family 6 protein [Nonomuraea jabiensis]|uniref:glycoside hydrolase family 6 protein n=1 Tax=Nonomuraea jabiensis TaxID=882448 RepID=UPI003D749DC3